jgi:hypothetical protein
MAIANHTHGAIANEQAEKERRAARCGAEHTSTQASAEPKDALTIDQFCRAHGISRALYYKLKVIGKGPAIITLGSKQIISREAAARWRAEGEAEPVTTTEPTKARAA